MRDQCSCGTIFEFSEKKLGQQIQCETCGKEVTLKEAVIPEEEETETNSFSLEKIKKWSFFYVVGLTLLLVFIYLTERTTERDVAIEKVQKSPTSLGGTLLQRSRILLRQVRHEHRKCTGRWNAYEIDSVDSKGEWKVTFEIFSFEGYSLRKAEFQLFLANDSLVLPMNQYALEIYGRTEINIEDVRNQMTHQTQFLRNKLLSNQRDMLQKSRDPKIKPKLLKKKE